jgi:GWxTD domain-containing protein
MGALRVSFALLLAAIPGLVPLAAQTSSTADAAAVMQAGLAILEQARTTDGRQFDRARDTFRRAHRLDPGWAYPLLGIGWAESGKGDWLSAEPLNLGTRVGHGAYRAAIQALIDATERDPAMTPAIMEMDRVATALRDTAVDRQVLSAIHASVSKGNSDPATLLILGRRERANGRLELSLGILRRFMADSSNLSLARFEIARSLLTEGGREGDSLYFGSALSDDSTTIAELRADLVSIAEEDELAQFDTASGESRLQFLRRFWQDRARRDLRSPEERLREHYRRLRYARQQFVLSSNRRYYGLRDLYRAPPTETLDDRGVVYVRHGEPDQRIRPQMFGLLPNETWLYHQPDGDLLLHFSSGGEGFEGGDLTDYRLVPSVFDLRGNGAPQDMLIASRFEISDLYERIMSWGPIGARRVAREERLWGERSADIGTRMDGFQLKFSHPLESRTDLLAIGRRGGNTLLQVIYSLPENPGGSPIRLRFALFDSTGAVRGWLDSSALSEPMGAGSGGRFELPAPPGKFFYRMALEVGRSGIVTPRDSIVIPDLTLSSLTLSGVAFGQAGDNIAWPLGPNDSAFVNPNRDFAGNSELQLFYEVYGLTSGAAYSASILVFDRKRERSGTRRLRLTFTEEAGGEISRVRRGVKLEGLKEGEYWLELRISDGTGSQVTTRKAFRVVSVAH